jgi:rod shape-determining protein MreC
MKHKNIFPYLILFFIILSVMGLSKANSDFLRGQTASILRAPWESLTHYKLSMERFFKSFSWSSRKEMDDEALQEIQELLLKNQILETELKKLQNLFGEDLAGFFDFNFDCIPAKVIFRTPSTWNSALWLNVGSDDNFKMEREIIVKNSPVVLGTSIIGVIDLVGKKQSRVRLITDSGLRPAVRVRRSYGNKTYFLAKGEIYGSSQPLWKSEGILLQGIGFNYDFPDEEGPARDLRTGRFINDHSNKPAMPIIKVGDALVTTGLDGVFPPGLDVAAVTKIYPLKEGDYFYEIEAKPAAGNLYDLSYVFVIPPATPESSILNQYD